MSKQHGFTIVELTVVVLVVGILAAVVYGRFGSVPGKGYDTSVVTDAGNLDIALANLTSKNTGGVVSISDANGDDVDDGYNYDDSLMNDPTQNALNTQIGFEPSKGKGNVIAAKVTSDGLEYCIRVHNVRSSLYKTAATAYVQVSNTNVTSTTTTCTHT